MGVVRDGSIVLGPGVGVGGSPFDYTSKRQAGLPWPTPCGAKQLPCPTCEWSLVCQVPPELQHCDRSFLAVRASTA